MYLYIEVNASHSIWVVIAVKLRRVDTQYLNESNPKWSGTNNFNVIYQNWNFIIKLGKTVWRLLCVRI